MGQTPAKTRIFHVAFGGNVETSHGSPRETMDAALNRLVRNKIRITRRSRFYDTPAFPAGSGPNFVNGVVEIETELSRRQLLVHLHDVEAEFGRMRRNRWGARTLDLDILTCQQETLPNLEKWQYWFDLPPEKQQIEAPETLILPHPRMQDRAFVLVPLAEVAPKWQHPVLGQTVLELLNALPENLRNEVKPL